MRTTILLLVLLLPILAYSDNLIKPGAKDPSQARYMFLQDSTGATVPAVVVYTSDGSGNIIPLSSSGLATSVSQGNAGSSAQAWWVQAASWPLPTNAAQESGGHLASIDSKLPALGNHAMAGSVSVTIASDQAAIPVSGTITATNPSVGTNGAAIPGSSTLVGVKDNSGNLQPLTLTSGGALKTDSSATTQPISAASLPLPSNAAQESGGHLASLDTKLGSGPVAQDSTVANTQGSVFGGVAGSKSDLMGVQFNTSLPVLSNTQQSALQSDSSGRLLVGSIAAALPAGSNAIGSVSVSNFPGTQPVSGTVTANAGTGTFTVGQATGSNLHTAVDSLPALPTGANTIGAVNQAGAPWSVSGSGNFTVVQPTGTNLHAVVDSGTVTANIGTTNGLALDNTVGSVQGSVAGGTAGTKSSLDGGQFNTSLPALTNGQQAALQVDSSARLLIGSIASALPSGGNTIGNVGQSGAPWGVTVSTALPTGANVIGAVTQSGGPWTTSDSADGSVSGGAAGTKSILSGGQFNSALPSLTNGQQAALQSDSSGRLLVGSIASALPTGTNSIGQVTANAGTGNFTVVQSSGANLHTDVDSLPALPAGSNNIGSVNQGTSPWVTSDQADGSVSGGSAGSKSLLGGLQFNTSLPTLTNGQQSALQGDSSGRLLIGALSTGSNAIGTVAINAALPTGSNSIGSVTANIGTTGGLALDNTLKNVQGAASGGVAATSSNLVGGTFNTSLPSLTNGQQSAFQTDSNARLLIGSIASALPAGGNTIGSVNQGTSPWISSDQADGSVSGGAAGSKSILSGGQFNSALPSLTNGQQAALQSDSSGRLIVGSIANALPTGGNVIGAVTQSGGPWSTTDSADGSVTGGAAGSKSILAGVQFNSALPSLTNGQQSAAQADSSGRILVGSIASALPTGANTIGSVNAIESGTWNVRVQDTAGTGINSQAVGGNQYLDVANTSSATAGSAVPARADLMAGQDGGGLARNVSVDASGNVNSNIVSSVPNTDFNTSGSLTAACASGTGCAAGSTLSLSTNGLGTAVLNISGTFSGTVVVDTSTDNFSTFVTDYLVAAGGVPTNAGVTSAGYYRVLGVGAKKQVRARCTVFTSGSITTVLTASSGNATQSVVSVQAGAFLNTSNTNDGNGNPIGSDTIGGNRYFRVNEASVGATGAAVPTSATAMGGSDGTNLRMLGTDTNGDLEVVGTVASASADSGAPVKVGTKYNATLPTFTDGNRADMQTNQFGMLATTGRWKFRNLTGNATTTVKSGSGTLHSYCVNNQPTGGTVNIFDNTAGSGTLIATLTMATGTTGYCSGPIDAEFATGLTVVTAGAGANNVTFYYQ